MSCFPTLYPVSKNGLVAPTIGVEDKTSQRKQNLLQVIRVDVFFPLPSRVIVAAYNSSETGRFLKRKRVVNGSVLDIDIFAGRLEERRMPRPFPSFPEGVRP